jgi:hypothetical protein
VKKLERRKEGRQKGKKGGERAEGGRQKEKEQEGKRGPDISSD